MDSLVEQAFSVVRVVGIDEAAVSAFQGRWGGLDLAAFTRALQGPPQDQQVAIFAIGSLRSRWARDTLLPFLKSEVPAVRWAATLELAEQREEEAFLVLLHMAQEFLPPHLPVQYDWYDVRHIDVARLLGKWGREEAAPVLQNTLYDLWREEQQTQGDVQLWWKYEDALVYALGQLGVFNALVAMPAHPRRSFWEITLVLGYLNAEEETKKTRIEMALDQQEDSLLALVPALLKEQLKWSDQDATCWQTMYQREYLARWEAK